MIATRESAHPSSEVHHLHHQHRHDCGLVGHEWLAMRQWRQGCERAIVAAVARDAMAPARAPALAIEPRTVSSIVCHHWRAHRSASIPNSTRVTCAIRRTTTHDATARARAPARTRARPSRAALVSRPLARARPRAPSSERACLPV